MTKDFFVQYELITQVMKQWVGLRGGACCLVPSLSPNTPETTSGASVSSQHAGEEGEWKMPSRVLWTRPANWTVPNFH